MPISNRDEQTLQTVAWQVGDVLYTHDEYTKASQEMLDWYRRLRHAPGLGFQPKPCPTSDAGWDAVILKRPDRSCGQHSPISDDESTLVMDQLLIEGLRTVPTCWYDRSVLAELIQGKYGRHDQLTTLLLIDYFKGVRPTNADHALTAENLEQLVALPIEDGSIDPPQYISDFFNAFGSVVWDHPSKRPLSFMEILHNTRKLDNKATPNQKAMRLFYRIYQTVDADICRHTNTLTIIGQSVEWRISPQQPPYPDGEFYRVQGWNARNGHWEAVCIHSLVQHLPVGDHLSTLLRAFSNDTAVAELIESIQPLVLNYGGFRYAH